MPINSSNKNHIIITKGDSGATHHYIYPQDKACIVNTKSNSTINITLPNAHTISSTRKVNLSLYQSISKQGRNTVILP